MGADDFAGNGVGEDHRLVPPAPSAVTGESTRAQPAGPADRDGLARLAGAPAPAGAPTAGPANAPGPAAGVAAVVVNYNAARLLGPCLRSLAGEGVAEVVVVDNASVDNSRQVAADGDAQWVADRRQSRVRRGRQPRRGGVGRPAPAPTCWSAIRTSNFARRRWRPWLLPLSATRRSAWWAPVSTTWTGPSTRRPGPSPTCSSPWGTACWACWRRATASPAGTACSIGTTDRPPRWTGYRAPASLCAGRRGSRSVGSTPPTSCTSKTLICAGGSTGPAGRSAMNRRPRSCTCRGLDGPASLPDARRPPPVDVAVRLPHHDRAEAPGPARGGRRVGGATGAGDARAPPRLGLARRRPG